MPAAHSPPQPARHGHRVVSLGSSLQQKQASQMRGHASVVMLKSDQVEVVGGVTVGASLFL